MRDENFYGYCADGHLHQIDPEFVLTAMKYGEDFESKMFLPNDIEESSMEDESSFIPLAPTNCPNLRKMLLFDRPWRTNKLPERRLAPYLSDTDNARTSVIYLNDFERHEDRFSETKQQGKESLYELIKDALLPEVNREQAQEMTYEILRQTFLRKFWSIEEQQKTYSDLRRSQYPMYKEQRVRDFVFYWIELFSCQTYYLTRTVYKMIMRKIPQVYHEPMQQFKNGGFFDNFYGTLLQFENTKWPGKYTDYMEEISRHTNYSDETPRHTDYSEEIPRLTDYPEEIPRHNEQRFSRSMITCDAVFSFVIVVLGLGIACYVYYDPHVGLGGS